MAFEHVDWDKLRQAIRQGTCTPFVGAGACAGYLPLAGDLAEALAEDDDYLMNRGRRDLARITQYMAVKHTDGNYPKGELAAFFGLRAARPKVLERAGRLAQLYQSRKIPNPSDKNDPHSVLADLGAAIYLTTNYDDFMFSALKRRASELGLGDPKRDFCRWTNSLFYEKQSPFDLGFKPSREQPVVYHLHGHAGVPESIVTTEDDYTDFIVNISGELTVSKIGKGKKERLPAAIRTAVRNHTLIFVGYQVADQNLRVVLRLLSQTLGSADKRLNVAIQLSPETGPADESTISHIQAYLEARYKWSLNLQVYWGDAREFAKELRMQMEERPLPSEPYGSEIRDIRALPGPSPL